MCPTTTSESPAARAARSTIATPNLERLGNWELLRPIGAGQLASVYQARPSGNTASTAAAYAIKVLHSQWQDERGLAILAREALVSRRVAHAHLLPILAAQLNSPPYYLAMPLLEGCSLAELLSKQAPLDLPAAFWNARQAAEALGALHKAGWMHADVKPSNIFVAPNGHVTLIDLGFSRHSNEHSRLADRVVVGTINYMAPELLSSSLGGDARSDIYSLGVTLFELLTGRLPFDAQDIAELAAQHRQDLPGDMRALVPHIPTRAARLVQQMLSKESLRRPVASEVVKRLAALEVDTFDERYAA